MSLDKLCLIHWLEFLEFRSTDTPKCLTDREDPRSIGAVDQRDFPILFKSKIFQVRFTFPNTFCDLKNNPVKNFTAFCFSTK